MIFDGLIVLHRLKSAQGDVSALSLSDIPPGSFVLDSCQRILAGFVLMSGESSLYFQTHRASQEWKARGFDLLRAKEAYSFLLQVATGLESQMLGETQVLGQIKSAWAETSKKETAQTKALSPLMQKLFEDSKFIRTSYLQDLGSMTYGSHLRKILESSQCSGASENRHRVLLVGAGQFAESLLPWLSQFDVVMTSRNSERSQELQRSVKRDFPQLQIQPWSAEWNRFSAIVSCVPGSEEVRVRLLTAVNPELVIFDLGEPSALKNESISCQKWDLDSLFECQKKEVQNRIIEIEKARMACKERTLLREEEATVTLPYGWDELWGFSA